MLLVVLNSDSAVKTAIPGVDEAVTVKLCTHPVQLDKAKAFDEQYVASKKSAVRTVGQMIEKANRQAKATGRSERVYYIEFENDLPNTLLARIAPVFDDAKIGSVAIEIRRGIFFAGRQEASINIAHHSLTGQGDFETFAEMLEIARFIAHEIGQ